MSEAISTPNPPEPENPSAQEWRQQSDGQHVLTMTDAEFDAFVNRIATLEAIDNGWGYSVQADKHASPEERAAIAARLLIKNIQGE